RETTLQHSAVSSSTELPWTVRQADVSQSASLARTTVGAPAWAAAMGRVTNYVMNDCGGGRRVLKLAWVINFQKLATIPVLGAFLARYHNTSAAALVYSKGESALCRNANLQWRNPKHSAPGADV